jgi:hypothetical protein
MCKDNQHAFMNKGDTIIKGFFRDIQFPIIICIKCGKQVDIDIEMM